MATARNEQDIWRVHSRMCKETRTSGIKYGRAQNQHALLLRNNLYMLNDVKIDGKRLKDLLRKCRGFVMGTTPNRSSSQRGLLP